MPLAAGRCPEPGSATFQGRRALAGGGVLSPHSAMVFEGGSAARCKKRGWLSLGCTCERAAGCARIDFRGAALGPGRPLLASARSIGVADGHIRRVTGIFFAILGQHVENLEGTTCRGNDARIDKSPFADQQSPAFQLMVEWSSPDFVETFRLELSGGVSMHPFVSQRRHVVEGRMSPMGIVPAFDEIKHGQSGLLP